MYKMIARQITSVLKKRLEKFPILSLTGPRQSGKSTLLRNCFPEYQYYNLERADYRRLIMTDPVGFLQSQGEKVIFDEAQQIPELFSYLQVISDERGTAGQYILSGSQSFLMNEHITQSLAGRTSICHLFPFDISEIKTGDDPFEAIFKGFYPRIYDFNIEPNEFYNSYIQTYIERDVRTIRSIENLNTFSRFLGLCAGRTGQILNLTSLANDAGISVNTAKSWLSLLEASFVLFQLQPYYKNFNKRLIKSPKIYFYDTGLACSLLNINTPQMVRTHYLYGSLYENFVISEMIKMQHHAGQKPTVYYWRDNNGVEIDCIVEDTRGQIHALEIKGGATINSDYLKNLKRFPAKSESVSKKVIYTGTDNIAMNDVKITGFNALEETLKNIVSKDS
jgi:uncharacterized protein